MTNPYRSPDTPLEFESDSAGFLTEPQQLSAGYGWTWFKQAFGLFMQNPLMWLVIFIVFIVLLMVLSMIPLVSLLTSIISPIFIGGIMMGCRDLEQGEGLNFNHLFAGFQHRGSQLAGLGVIQLVASIVIVIIPALLLIVFGMLSMTDMMDSMSQQMSDVAELYTAFLLYFLILTALMVPLIMGLWFASCLIVFHNFSAWEAFNLSFRACAVNLIPFLVYGLVGLLLALLASIPMGLGFLILGPVILLSMYSGYRSIFFRTA